MTQLARAWRIIEDFEYDVRSELARPHLNARRLGVLEKYSEERLLPMANEFEFTNRRAYDEMWDRILLSRQRLGIALEQFIDEEDEDFLDLGYESGDD